jgi:truncated hemoglobin YjbI
MTRNKGDLHGFGFKRQSRLTKKAGDSTMNDKLTPTIDENLVSKLVDVFYASMLDDYRINRYFYSRPVDDQTKPLKRLLNALLAGKPVEPKKLSELADDFFAAAFARGNAKPSLVNNRDFAFLEMFVTGDIVGSDEKPHLTLLCPGHSHLLRLQPIDDNYDVVLEILQNSLKQLNIPQDTAAEIMAFAASGRDGILGRGLAIYDDGDKSIEFRTHG